MGSFEREHDINRQRTIVKYIVLNNTEIIPRGNRGGKPPAAHPGYRSDGRSKLS